LSSLARAPTRRHVGPDRSRAGPVVRQLEPGPPSRAAPDHGDWESHFSGHIKRIRAGTQSFTGYGLTELVTILNKKLTIQRITIQGVPYVRIQGTKTGNNHWNL